MMSLVVRDSSQPPLPPRQGLMEGLGASCLVTGRVPIDGLMLQGYGSEWDRVVIDGGELAGSRRSGSGLHLCRADDGAKI
ncbi:hypothetical protein CDL15_Pgr014095 [Punica granatum]|uniref:Uncharacterized protein n=1 Tax=Punica granatum TaxID=22663 RepID=A0A218W9U2_PUNGR|nr:hypothetical protein CDL15_Pgr014095 [Punica granatum]PKI72669.1 hypothetical protein CRG98_006920 [Punica granatum]